ncbi:hypothetical protein TIFTF001_005291 [Ficus carica]|uniref:F-box/LRR-repeat protein 15/At3g58940/PEG3-like LRR domain-containing protein n=1 Tax=Ficus carica TaxID=3494 RepID=A0AA88DEJ5_FICCA|nr:hypothetical protein TIFTF001_005291 [Ficus carica]
MSYLSIKDAVRTSLFSSKWRYRQARLPNLALWGLLPPNFPWHKAWVHNKLVSNIIDQVLLLHSGPIHKFQLRELVFLDDCALDRWILHLTRSPVKDISLTNLRERDQGYNLPSCLFSCQSLINLKLIFCCLKPPPSSKGFSNLKRLGFLHVNLAQDVFENLVSSCPMLETLDLVDVRASSSDYLAGGVKLVEVLKPCIHLNYLVMETNVNNREESLTARCLLNIVPNLQELHIVTTIYLSYINHPFIDENVTGTETNFWEDGCRDCQFTKLQLVRLTRVTSTKPELDFIEFILLNSPVRERMIVGATCKDVQMELLKKLLPLRRASGRAQIIC